MLAVVRAASTVRVMPISAGKKLAAPSVISTPPSLTNLSNSATPGSPMPPVISADSPYAPRLGNAGVFL